MKSRAISFSLFSSVIQWNVVIQLDFVRARVSITTIDAACRRPANWKKKNYFIFHFCFENFFFFAPPIRRHIRSHRTIRATQQLSLTTILLAMPLSAMHTNARITKWEIICCVVTCARERPVEGKTKQKKRTICNYSLAVSWSTFLRNQQINPRHRMNRNGQFVALCAIQFRILSINARNHSLCVCRLDIGSVIACRICVQILWSDVVDRSTSVRLCSDKFNFVGHKVSATQRQYHRQLNANENRPAGNDYQTEICVYKFHIKGRPSINRPFMNPWSICAHKIRNQIFFFFSIFTE